MLQIIDLENKELLSEISNKESAAVTGGGPISALQYFLLINYLPLPADVRPILQANGYNILFNAAAPLNGIISD
ncbi:MAG: hypothetical protein KME23_12945 [Goleter apudmare HA4340-LM2]|jgi:hypothetical protein|nr:hypothetical protein [Goleter apudmare HA4340-LM2]